MCLPLTYSGNSHAFHARQIGSRNKLAEIYKSHKSYPHPCTVLVSPISPIITHCAMPTILRIHPPSPHPAPATTKGRRTLSLTSSPGRLLSRLPFAQRTRPSYPHVCWLPRKCLSLFPYHDPLLPGRRSTLNTPPSHLACTVHDRGVFQTRCVRSTHASHTTLNPSRRPRHHGVGARPLSDSYGSMWRADFQLLVGILDESLPLGLRP